MIKVDELEIESLNIKNQQEWSGAIAQDLQQIAVLHDKEVDETLIRALQEVAFPSNLGLRIEAGEGDDIQAYQFFETALRDLEVLDEETLDRLAVDYADIYLNHSLHASPFESVWLDEDHLLLQEPMFKIRKWYKRYGLASADWKTRSEDHLVLQLQFIATLLDPDYSFSETQALQKRLQDAVKFMDEHLLLWLADFCNIVAQRCETDFYASVAVLTHAYIDQLRDELAEITGIARPTAEELEELKSKATQTVVEEPISFVPGVAESW